MAPAFAASAVSATRGNGDTTPGVAAYVPLYPVRVLQSTPGSGVDNDGVESGPYAPGTSITVPIVGRAGVPDDDTVTAVAMSVTAVSTGGPGRLIVWSGEGDQPDTRDVTYPSSTQAQRSATSGVISQLGPDGSIEIVNLVGSANVFVDVVGYFTTAGTEGPAGSHRSSGCHWRSGIDWPAGYSGPGGGFPGRMGRQHHLQHRSGRLL